ncbi:MAG TPA: cysteine--tRNA ligase [Candidatus Saccharimonadales bacterium]|nr:cysteine--tRNA ligase [Candidatus Saccharimonadales bacterium]
MKLYNTRTRKIEALKPLKDNLIRIYSCGPTVYDRAHIGNLSSFIFVDTLRRTLDIAGFSVKHAMNITDVDDKTIRRSHEQYPAQNPRSALEKLTNKYTAAFQADMQAVGNDMDSLTLLRATDPRALEAMQQLILKLHEQGFAYTADDGVYFSIEAYRKSGKTYGQLLELSPNSTSRARIQNDEYDKASLHDFALWKKQKDGEPAWEFSLGGHDLTGRPGWHIECSAMSRLLLGQPFDIHTGGIDLVFPHHENEIAQSTADETNPLLATVFAHNEHILVDGKKMAKSAHNFYTLQDITKRGYDPLAFRLLVLQAHYRSQIHFSWENMEAAQHRLNDLQAIADLRHQPQISEMPGELNHLFKTTRQEIYDAMLDDLNSPLALTSLNKLFNYLAGIATPGVEGRYSEGILTFLDNVFGLQLSNRPDISNPQKQAIVTRQKARVAKDWKKSDELREQIKQQGIGLRDTPHGAVWHRL